MKKLLLITPVILTSQLSWGGTQLFLGNHGSNLNAIMPGARGNYYKCTNSVSFSCQSDYISIEYGSVSGGDGTAINPYILTNCSFITCACNYQSYLSGKTCVRCDFDALVAPDSSVIHANQGASACTYCPSNMLKTAYHPAAGIELTKCITCPSNSTCNGSTSLSCNKGYYGTSGCTQCPQWSGVFSSASPTTYVRGTTISAGATSISGCYIPSGTYWDNTGTFTLTAQCNAQ